MSRKKTSKSRGMTTKTSWRDCADTAYAAVAAAAAAATASRPVLIASRVAVFTTQQEQHKRETRKYWIGIIVKNTI